MQTSDFDYNLPQSNIAQTPVYPRDSCKLLVLDRAHNTIEHRHFYDIGDYLEPDDLIIANKTRVLPARLYGRKRYGTVVAETLLLKRREDLDPLGSIWECLVNPGRRLKPGVILDYREGGLHAPLTSPTVLEAEVLDFLEDNRGGRLIKFRPCGDLSLDAAIHRAGRVPLPPYINRYEGDPENYQTVYSMHEEHSAASPTAGLHFTKELINRLLDKGVLWKNVELEVGIDTFRLVEEDDPTKHVMHTERYHVSQDVVDAVHAAKKRGSRVIAIGTTSVRSLESAFSPDAPVSEPPLVAKGFENAPSSCALTHKGDLVARSNATTNLYIMPGFTWHVVDCMVTNFHVPRSTLMMMVSSFASRDMIMRAYEEAIKNDYRFLSFGDAMIML